MDERSLKAWTKEHDGTSKSVYDLTFPGFQTNFVTCICLSTNLNLVFAACLDDTIKLYNERLRLKSSLAWANGVVREMAYNSKRNELITAGSYGVKVNCKTRMCIYESFPFCCQTLLQSQAVLFAASTRKCRLVCGARF